MMPANSSSLTSRLGVRLVRPAQLMRMSTLPKDLITSSCSFWMEARSLTSQVARTVLRPAASMALAVASTSASRRALATTSAPESHRPSTRARPMPVVPPMTTASCPGEIERFESHGVFIGDEAPPGKRKAGGGRGQPIL